MRESSPLPHHLTPEAGAAAEASRAAEVSAPPLTSEEKRRIFKGMVIGELEAGFLRYSRREALLRYAAGLGISEFDACLLMAEAQFHSDQIEPIHFDTAATLETFTRPEAWSISMRLAFALAASVGIDLLLIYWLFA